MNPRVRSATSRTDLALALVFGCSQPVGVALAAAHEHTGRHPDALAYVLLVASGLVLVTRRAYPVTTFAATFVITMAYVLANYPDGPFWFPLIITFATLILVGHRLIAYSGLVAGYVIAIWLSNVIHHHSVDGWQSWGIAAWLVALLLVSELIRNRRAYLRANRQRLLDEQRLQIARDLHDVLAHSISLINVQAGVALELMDQRPEQARTALTAIKATSRDALIDVHSVLGQLREPGESAPRMPSPTLDDLDELVARAESAGLTVRTRIDGSPGAVPAPVQSAAYRIVQEALTNVARHAGPVRVEVGLSYSPDRVEVDVVNQPGRRTDSPSAGSGSGIDGMRERAAAFGGEVAAGVEPDGSFRVFAALPVQLARQP